MSDLFAYKVYIDQIMVSEIIPEEDFGTWERVYENNFYKIEEDNEYPNVLSTIDLKKEDGYLVWVGYNQSDSFGCAYNDAFEVIGILKEEKNTEELVKFIETAPYDEILHPFSHDQVPKIISIEGQNFDYRKWPWYDAIFESINSVHVTKVRLEKNIHPENPPVPSELLKEADELEALQFKEWKKYSENKSITSENLSLFCSAISILIQKLLLNSSAENYVDKSAKIKLSINKDPFINVILDNESRLSKKYGARITEYNINANTVAEEMLFDLDMEMDSVKKTWRELVKVMISSKENMLPSLITKNTGADEITVSWAPERKVKIQNL